MQIDEFVAVRIEGESRASTVTKTVKKAPTVVRARAKYKLGKVKSTTVHLALKSTGRSVLADVAKDRFTKRSLPV